MSMEMLFENLVQSSGNDYLQKEAQFMRGGPAALRVLQQKTTAPDTFTRLYAQSILAWMEGRRPENTAALKHLDMLPQKLAKTPIINPSPTRTADYLNKHFADKVAPILAIRLLKQTDMPQWRVYATLIYLGEQKIADTSDFIIRFICQTSNDEWRDTAVSTLEVIDDPQLHIKVLEQEVRLKKLNLSLPDVLKAKR